MNDLNAAEAAAALGISRATLYAYVSRGMLRSSPDPHDPRARRYNAADVARLKAQQAQRQAPERVAAAALDWGVPVLESHLTLIRDGRCFYRGYDSSMLAREYAFEQVASLLWSGQLPAQPTLFADHPAPAAPLAWIAAQAELSPLQRCQLALPLLAAHDPAGYDIRPAAVIRSGGRIVRRLAGLLGGSQGAHPVATLLQRGLAPHDPSATRLINMALILCADHELNVSAFTARCVASAAASPYDVVSAGLSALAGVRHGGQTERASALLYEVNSPAHAQRVIAERLRRGDAIPGFGHKLYPNGDPRGSTLITQISLHYPHIPVVERGLALIDAAQTLLNERPTIDFGLALLEAVWSAPRGTALALFALGRTAGWLAHASEEYASERLIRPRAHYVGPEPDQDRLRRGT